jgi:hypothetical protein
MQKISEDKIAPIILDFTKADNVNESWLKSFGTAIKIILNNIFGGSNVPVSVRGTEKEISTFRDTIAAEKDYVSSFQKYGLDNPATYRTKSLLDQRVNKFERATGLKWPFK